MEQSWHSFSFLKSRTWNFRATQGEQASACFSSTDRSSRRLERRSNLIRCHRDGTFQISRPSATRKPASGRLHSPVDDYMHDLDEEQDCGGIPSHCHPVLEANIPGRCFGGRFPACYAFFVRTASASSTPRRPAGRQGRSRTFPPLNLLLLQLLPLLASASPISTRFLPLPDFH